MVKDSIYKKDKSKKENSLDYYISKTSSLINGKKWWNDEEESQFQNESELKKHAFLKKNIKAASVIPEKVETQQDIPNKMGYFETRFGTLEVGYEKYKKNSSIGFSLVPESLKDTEKIPVHDLNDPNNYFGGSISGRNKKFKASSLSFKYDPEHQKDIQKIEKDNDGIMDEEEKLLYQYKKEDDQIEFLQKSRTQFKDKNRIDKEIEKIRDVKEEKEEDNLAFLKELDQFVDKIKKEKLKKYVDSDDFINMKKRIDELSGTPNISEMSLEELRRLLEKLLKRKELQELPGGFSDINLEKLSENEIKKLILNLTKQLSGEESKI